MCQMVHPCLSKMASYIFALKMYRGNRGTVDTFFCLEFWHVCLTIKFPLGMPMLGNLSNYQFSYIAAYAEILVVFLKNEIKKKFPGHHGT